MIQFYSLSLDVLYVYSFLSQQLSLIVELLNEQFATKRLKDVTAGELIKFFGVLVLTTRAKVNVRRDLWKTTRDSKYTPVFDFGGKTGMTVLVVGIGLMRFLAG